MLRQRALMLRRIRGFFEQREVLEVDTPVLSAAATPAPYLNSFHTASPTRVPARYLQTSPEFAMKRLLAAGSGAVYQVCKAFREGESGALHNPEFTLLEWYRPGWDTDRLMDEVETLVAAELPDIGFQRMSYADAFRRWVGIDPERAPIAALREAAAAAGPSAAMDDADRDAWLDLLLSFRLAPAMAREGAVFLYDYPASQASLARIKPSTTAREAPVADRFELFVNGIELANGFGELTDADEQRRRFEAENRARIGQGLAQVPLDECFLDALDYGMPASSGVALGVDRLLLLATGSERLEQVLAFPWDRA